MENNITSNKTDQNEFSISDSAAKRIAFLAKKEPAGSFLRIEVKGGGCSGFQYDMNFDTEIGEEDVSFENDKTKVVIDSTSLQFIKGSMIDYVETLGSAAFEIKNPNAASSCGCGNSFSV